jgi:hypothetical protein
MPQISRFFGIIIRMYYNDHNPPHFHAEYGEFEAMIGIDTASILSGALPPRIMGFVAEWTLQHQKELMDNWKRSKNKESLLPIEPLQ